MKIYEPTGLRVSHIDATEVYRQASSCYIAKTLDIEQLTTFASRMSLVLKLSGTLVPDFVEVVTKSDRESIYANHKVLSSQISDVDNINLRESEHKADDSSSFILQSVEMPKIATKDDSIKGLVSLVSCLSKPVLSQSAPENSKKESKDNIGSALACETKITSEDNFHENNVPSENKSNANHNDIIKVLNDALKSTKPFKSSNILTDTHVVMHLKPRKEWITYNTISSLIEGYPVYHKTYTKADSDDDDIITSFVLTTQPYYDSDASIKVTTTYSKSLLQSSRSEALLKSSQNHNKSLNDLLAIEVKLCDTVILQLENDFTLKKREAPKSVYLSKLLKGKILRGAQVYTTKHNKENGKLSGVNHTKYTSKEICISGTSHPLYSITSYALKVSNNNTLETTMNPNNLMNISYVEKLFNKYE